DGVGYFRMFNGIRESEGFDGKGLYMKRYVGIFNEIDGKYLDDREGNEWKVFEEGIELGGDYGREMVDDEEKGR
ncbi:FAD-binding domain-containing protein, partial [Staphylococcus aureus]|uniref:FAD-binding domain-containing protein n=1 Tax=Staphylococcus aureus TaxID=1280 RepID=UPI0028CB3C8B